MQLLHAFKTSELVGVMVVGLVLIFIRARITPAFLMIITCFIQVVAQANMLNPGRDESISTETLLVITTSLSAFSIGGFLVSLCTYIHEEYGQKQWGVIFGSILAPGALGILAFDEAIVFVTLQIFGRRGKETID